MKELKGTQTEKNLMDSFAGESQAHMRYKLFAKVAKKEGLKDAEAFFKQASEEEKGHATTWYKLLNGGKLPTTKESVVYQIEKEKAEFEDTEGSYEHMAKVAREEGFEEIAKHFEEIASEEEDHEKHLSAILEAIENGTLVAQDCDCEDCDCEDCDCEDCDCEDCDCEDCDCK